MTRAVIDLLVWLTVAADVFVVVVAAAFVMRRRAFGRRLWGLVEAWVAPSALGLAWLVAFVATAGSLFLSEVANFVPCPLCWYQRIAMYPLAIVLGIAAIRRDRQIWRYAVPLALAGLVIAAYHYQLEWFPDQAHLGCPADGGCTTRWIWRLGFISIPFMAGSAFATVAILLGVARITPEEVDG